ncbi:MAG: hypothetical protein Q4B26_02090 [Eubacteriales bacterium]|nr:hypothetical protein [Eubacteriales bacterium]
MEHAKKDEKEPEMQQDQGIDLEVSRVIADLISELVNVADAYKLDRDVMMKYFAKTFSNFSQIASIKKWKVEKSADLMEGRKE